MSDEGEDVTVDQQSEAKQSDAASDRNTVGSDDGERSSSDEESRDSATGCPDMPKEDDLAGEDGGDNAPVVQEHGDVSPGGGRLDYGPDYDNGSASEGVEVEEPKLGEHDENDGEMNNDSDEGQLSDDEPPPKETPPKQSPKPVASDLEDGEVLDDEDDEGEVKEMPVSKPAVSAPPPPQPQQQRVIPLRQASFGARDDRVLGPRPPIFHERPLSPPPRRNGRISPVGWPAPPPRLPPPPPASGLPSLLRSITPPEMIVPPPLPRGRISPRRSPPDIDIIEDVVAPLGLPPPVGRPARAPGPEETPWDRGLRQARALVRQAVKRQETDVDFEDKRLNLTVGDPPPKEEDPIADPPTSSSSGRGGPPPRAVSRSPSVEDRVPPGPRSLVSLPLPRDPYEDDLRAIDPIARAERYYYDEPPLSLARIPPRDDFYDRRPYDDRLDDYYDGGRRDFYSSGYRGQPPPYDKERSNSRNQWGQPINGNNANNGGYGRNNGGRYNNYPTRRNTVYGNGVDSGRGRNDSRNDRDNRPRNDRGYGANERQLPYSRPTRPERELPYDPPSRSKANEWTDPWRRSSSATRRGGRSRGGSSSESPSPTDPPPAPATADHRNQHGRKRKYSSSSYSSGSSRSRSGSSSSSSSSSSSRSSGWSSDNSSPTPAANKKNKKKPSTQKDSSGPSVNKKKRSKVVNSRKSKSPPSLESTTLGGALKKLTQPVNPPVRRDPTPEKNSLGKKSGKSSSPSKDRQPIKLKIINKSKVQAHDAPDEDDDDQADIPNSSSDDEASNPRSDSQPNTRARREFLLKQLQAVNDAISKKRARVS